MLKYGQEEFYVQCISQEEMLWVAAGRHEELTVNCVQISTLITTVSLIERISTAWDMSRAFGLDTRT